MDNELTEKELLQKIQAAGRADNPELDPKDTEEIPEQYQNLGGDFSGNC